MHEDSLLRVPRTAGALAMSYWRFDLAELLEEQDESIKAAKESIAGLTKRIKAAKRKA